MMESRGESLTTQEPQERQRGQKTMRSSNSKEARRAVEAYVLSEIDRRTDDDAPETTRPVTRAFETLKDEMKWQSAYDSADRVIMGEDLAKKYRAAGRRNFINATTPYHVWYLAARIGEFGAYTDDAREHLASWMDETPEEAARFDSDKVVAQFAHLTASAFERLYTRETEPHRIPTGEFKRILQEDSREHYFFDRATMRYHRQTMRDITVTGFYLVTDETDRVHDCYKVESMQASSPEDPRHLVTYYFDRVTLLLVFPKEA